MEKKPLNSSEEIDLLYFFRPVTNAAKAATNWGVSYVKLLAHNRYLFVAILVLGSIAGYCLRFVIPPSYKTDGLFVSGMIPGRYCVRLLNSLNELRRPGNIPVLAKELNISTDAAWEIRNILAEASARDTFIIEKKDSSMSVFKITLVMSKMDHIEEVQRGLVNYLVNNDYVRKRVEARRNNMRIQIANLDSTIRSLDSLRTLVNSSVVPRSQGQGIILGEPINPVSIYQAEVNYLRDRLYMQERLALGDHIEVLQPFFKLNEYNNPNYDKLMNYAFAASFLFGLLVVALIGRRPKA